MIHDIIQKLTENIFEIQGLSEEKTPTNLLDYKVQKSNVEQYKHLTGGQIR